MAVSAVPARGPDADTFSRQFRSRVGGPAEVAGEEPSRAVALVFRAPGSACPEWACNVFIPSRRRRRTTQPRMCGRIPRRSTESGTSTGTVIFPAASIRGRSYTKNPTEAHGSKPGFDRRQHQPGHDTQRHAGRSRSAPSTPNLGQRLQGVPGSPAIPAPARSRQRHVVVDDDRGRSASPAGPGPDGSPSAHC